MSPVYRLRSIIVIRYLNPLTKTEPSAEFEQCQRAGRVFLWSSLSFWCIHVANGQIVSIRGYCDPRPMLAGTKIPT